MSRSRSTTSSRIDAEWFLRHLLRSGRNSADLGRHLGIHRSAVSRIWTGERKIKSTEVRGVADFLGVTVDEVLAHANLQPGFGENKQAAWQADAEDAPAGDLPNLEGGPMEKKRARHPVFGSMKGTSIVKPGVDLAKPVWTADGADDQAGKKPYRHPAWGALKGMITIPPDIDLTEPAYEDWKALYGEDE